MLKKPFNPERQEKEFSLPASQSAEHGVLSCFLQSPELIGHFKSTYPIECFSRVDSKAVWECLDDLHRQKKPIDLVLVSQWFGDRDMWHTIGGPGTLAELLNFVPTPAHYPHYAGILLDKLNLRLLVQECDELRAAAYSHEDQSGELAKLVAEKTSKINAAFQRGHKDTSFDEQLASATMQFDDAMAGKTPSCIPSPWACWNTYLGGITRGYMLIMAERKQGKSSLAKDLFMHVGVKLNRRAQYFSYEMEAEDIIRRMVCEISGCPSDVVFSPDVFPPTKQQRKAIADAFTALHGAPIQVIYEPRMDVDGIAYRVRKFQPELAIVDYLQLLPRPPGLEKNAGYERHVAENSHQLQMLRGEMGRGTLAVLSQVNQAGDARWSAGTENDIDISLKIEDAGILVRNRRNGKSGAYLPIFLDGATFSFKENDPFDGPP